MRPRSFCLSSPERCFFRKLIRCYSTLTCLAPTASLAAHDAEAFHEFGSIPGRNLFPVQLAGVGDEAAQIGVVAWPGVRIRLWAMA